MKSRNGFTGIFLKWSLALLLFCGSARAFTQETKKNLPAFKMQLTNKTLFNSPADIKKNVPVMLVYFSPTCEHCQDFTKHIIEKNGAFKKVQILMVTYLPVTDIKKFEIDFDLAKYPNIKAGSEGNAFLVPKFYDIKTFPFIALFNKKGVLQTSYRTVPAMDVLLNELKKI